MSTPADIMPRRQRYENVRAQLESEASSFMAHWRELAEFFAPRRGRWVTSDRNRGDKRHNKIIDSTGVFAAQTLASGMMAGITSPARPWFRLTTPYRQLNELESVKQWLEDVTSEMRTMFVQSNVYQGLPTLYLDMGVFATGAVLVEEDMEKGLRFYPLPLGSFVLGNDSKNRVRIFYRKFSMTVRQILEKWGRWGVSADGKREIVDWSNLSLHVKSLYESNSLEAWVDVVHTIQPNPDWDEKRLQAKFKRFISCYYELGSESANSATHFGPNDDIFLHESGYDYFPVLVGRWRVTGEDVYGTDSPGMVALGDNKQLQHGEKKGAKALDKMVDPPLKGPPSLKNRRVSMLPGDISYTVDSQQEGKLEPIHTVDPRLDHLEAKQAQKRSLINRAFFVDLILQLTLDQRNTPPTAEEIRARKDEIMLAFGPVLEHLNELFDMLIDIAFMVMERQGKLPPPPPELEGVALKVEYISIMAQAQKLLGLSAIERFFAFVAQVAERTQNPEVLDKVNVDQSIDLYADMSSVPAGIVRSDDDVEAIRADRAKRRDATEAAAVAREQAGAARDLAGADMTGDNALTRLMRQAQAGQITPQ